MAHAMPQSLIPSSARSSSRLSYISGQVTAARITHSLREVRGRCDEGFDFCMVGQGQYETRRDRT